MRKSPGTEGEDGHRTFLVETQLYKTISRRIQLAWGASWKPMAGKAYRVYPPYRRRSSPSRKQSSWAERSSEPTWFLGKQAQHKPGIFAGIIPMAVVASGVR